MARGIEGIKEKMPELSRVRLPVSKFNPNVLHPRIGSEPQQQISLLGPAWLLVRLLRRQRELFQPVLDQALDRRWQP
jgi:hypothetical protein